LFAAGGFPLFPLWHAGTKNMPMLADHASNGGEAYGIVRMIFDGIVARLRRDQRFHTVTVSELDLLFADALRDAEHLLVVKLRGRVRADDLGDNQ
jgi:hypothetical protein